MGGESEVTARGSWRLAKEGKGRQSRKASRRRTWDGEGGLRCFKKTQTPFCGLHNHYMASFLSFSFAVWLPLAEHPGALHDQLPLLLTVSTTLP